MSANPQNITAWFLDAATRHPDIQHVASDPKKQRFFEMEWDQMMANGQKLNAKDWTLVLEDYTEVFRDNEGDYISILQDLAFMVCKHAPRNEDAAAILILYREARRIAKSIVAKMKEDEREQCDADVPDGVDPFRLVDLSTLRIMPVKPPLFDNAYGVRVVVRVRTDTEQVTFRRDEVAWLPLI